MEDFVDLSNDHISELRAKAEKELNDLEKEFLMHREKILLENKKEIEKHFRAQELKEEEYVNQRENNEEQYHAEIKRLKQTKYKEYFDLKLALENEIESHEKCLEDMRAIYTLNSVKLNYNFKVLFKTLLIFRFYQKKRMRIRHWLRLLKKRKDIF
jgi:dynein regulatory complex protein 1